MARRTGLIAILDALGAATYSDEEIDRFLESRSVVLDLLNEKADAGKIAKDRLRVFTFNDTVVIVYLAVPGNGVTLDDIETFAIRLRAFMMQSFQNRILFRGSLSVGSFREVDDETNTVMGQAVSDAAAWYDKADWIGIAATPHASMYIQSLVERHGKDLEHILVDYHVPLKGRAAVNTKAVNWPKAFYVKGLRPNPMIAARSQLLTFLSQHQAPIGTESKYSNTVAFFDAIVEKQKLLKRTQVSTQP
jgi:hypothetical protein